MFVLAAMAYAGQLGMSQNGYHPGATELVADPDWQLFAPVQLQDMEDIPSRKRANVGFYLTYDRVYSLVSRPESFGGSNNLDPAWGNRYDFGWSKSKGGWNFSVFNTNGPDKYNRYIQRQLNYLPTPHTAVNGTIGALLQTPENLSQIFSTYEMLDPVNAGTLKSFEANKTWRLEPYRYGGILEPLIGVRYAGFRDIHIDDDYEPVALVDAAGTIVGFQETFARESRLTDNNMLLGQMGFRYMKFVRRWTFSNETKVFAGHVFQNQDVTFDEYVNTYPTPIPLGVPPASEGDRNGTLFGSSRNKNNTVGLDLRVEAAYKAFKSVDLRVGFNLLYFGRGIARTDTNLDDDSLSAKADRKQHLTMPGFTAGITWNR
jgi:hypothetical protein